MPEIHVASISICEIASCHMRKVEWVGELPYWEGASGLLEQRHGAELRRQRAGDEVVVRAEVLEHLPYEEGCHIRKVAERR